MDFDFLSFKICPDLRKMLEKNGFKRPTPIQTKAIPPFIESKDVIIQSQTGSGKTLAFLIPILNFYLKNKTASKNNIVALIITPTRELSLQIKEVVDLFSVNSVCFIGGLEINDDINKLNEDVKIVIGTPGRLYEIVNKTKCLFNKISYLVLDEADKLMNLGFEYKILDIINLLPKTRITGLFSATLDEKIVKLSKHALRNPVTIKNDGFEIPEELIINYLTLPADQKLWATINYIENKRSIIFFATCNQVDFFYSLLKASGLKNIFKIHGKMSQKDRSEVYKNLSLENSVLLCTDVAARGIDFKNVDIVIHFDIPKEFSNVIHRSGRTARNGSKGISILFLMPNEVSYIDYLKIKNIEVMEIKEEFKSRIDEYKKLMDTQMLDFSVRAFVSYVRSYKEHTLNYILDFTTLDFEKIVDLYMLEKVPGMKELKNVSFSKFMKPKETKKRRKVIPKKKNALHKEKKTKNRKKQ